MGIISNNDLHKQLEFQFGKKLPPANSLISQPKKKILVWSDAVIATTGFGIVSKHLCAALYNTGLYEIDQLAINYFGDFYDKKTVPYTLVPARLGDHNDPYGNKMFVNAVQKGNYDIIFIINDTFVVEQAAKALEQIRVNKRNTGQKVPNIVYYYPVDCRFLARGSHMVRIADRAVAYTNFAKEDTLKVPNLTVHNVIYHGTDVKTFRPFSEPERVALRKQFFNIHDPERFILMNVNRNSLRKNIAQTLIAFSEFRKLVPNSTLYLHTKPQDGVSGSHIVDLAVCLEELGLNTTTDVLFPVNYHPAQGFPEETVNKVYNCGHAFITTCLGEGWGLTITEAMAAGIPVIAGRHTSIPEILGNNGERGYIYECNEKVYVDNSGYRVTGRIEEIVQVMFRAYQDWKNNSDSRKQIISNARAFVEKYSWSNVSQDWVKLFGSLKDLPTGAGACATGEKI